MQHYPDMGVTSRRRRSRRSGRGGLKEGGVPVSVSVSVSVSASVLAPVLPTHGRNLSVLGF
jgi:hypothetical protein